MLNYAPYPPVPDLYTVITLSPSANVIPLHPREVGMLTATMIDKHLAPAPGFPPVLLRSSRCLTYLVGRS